MRRLSLLLVALCCVMGLMLWEQEGSKPTQPTPSPTPTATATPALDRVKVEEVTLSAAPTPQPVVMLRVRDGGETRSVPLEEYLVHVVAGEMPAMYEEEALKAQAVAARSYIAWKMPANGGGGCGECDICTDSTHCMAYKSDEEMRRSWGEQYETYRGKIEAAVAATAGEVMLYNGQPIQALFHASSGGNTEDAQAVWGEYCPYLTSVKSDDVGTEKVKRIKTKELVEQLNRAFDGAGLTVDNVRERFVVSGRTSSGRVDEVKVGRIVATGRAVRSALGLNSTQFEVRYDGDEAVLTTEGYGHGVGMSQVGANGMALEGKGYREILTHYYVGAGMGELTVDSEVRDTGKRVPH